MRHLAVLNQNHYRIRMSSASMAIPHRYRSIRPFAPSAGSATKPPLTGKDLNRSIAGANRIVSERSVTNSSANRYR